MTEATFITDRGWIVANGPLPNGDVHTAILIPEEDASEIPPGLDANAPTTALRMPGNNGQLTPEALKQVQGRLAQHSQHRIPPLRKLQ